jgi:hypothetical protein
MDEKSICVNCERMDKDDRFEIIHDLNPFLAVYAKCHIEELNSEYVDYVDGKKYDIVHTVNCRSMNFHGDCKYFIPIKNTKRLTWFNRFWLKFKSIV